MALRPTMARILKSSDRHVEWLRVFGKDRVRLFGPIPFKAQGPDGVREFYHVHESELTPEVRERLIDHIAAKFNLSRDEVKHSIDDPSHGVRILADDVFVECDARLFL